MADDSQNDGTREPLTVASAAKVFESLLSDESEDTDTRETPQEPAEASESETAEDSEQETAETDESVESEEESGDEPNAEETPQPKTRRIKYNGEEIEVTEEELEKGYSRTADYTRKTQELAERRKALDAEDQAGRGEREQVATVLKQLEGALRELTPQEPDWAELQATDPDKFAATWAAWQQHQKRIDAVAKERKDADERVLADNQKKFGEFVEAERVKFFDAHPELKDEKRWGEEKTALATFAKSTGFTSEEIASVYDHRLLTVLRKAMQFDALQKAKPVVQQKLEGKEVVVKPGSKGQVKPKVTELTRSRQRLAKDGSIRNAAEVFMHLES